MEVALKTFSSSLGRQPWFYGWGFNLPRGQALLEKWNLIPDGIDILITHGPPLGKKISVLLAVNFKWLYSNCWLSLDKEWKPDLRKSKVTSLPMSAAPELQVYVLWLLTAYGRELNNGYKNKVLINWVLMSFINKWGSVFLRIYPRCHWLVKSVDLKHGAVLKSNAGLLCSTIILPHLHQHPPYLPWICMLTWFISCLTNPNTVVVGLSLDRVNCLF